MEEQEELRQIPVEVASALVADQEVEAARPVWQMAKVVVEVLAVQVFETQTATESRGQN